MLFSVLIANYNNGKYLQEAIDSILAQTYSNWEIVLVDDKSTDNSFEIYDKYKSDNRFHIYYNEENKGCGYTKRRCVEMAHGELCGFLDPDDILTNDALEVMVNEHGCFDDVALVYSKYYLSDVNLNIQGESNHQCELPEGKSFLEYGRGAVSQFATFKKSFYDLTEGIGTCYKRAVDHDLYYLLEEVGKLHFVDKPLYYYRNNTGNNISTNENGEKAFLWDLIVMADACRRRGLDVEMLLAEKFENHLVDLQTTAYVKGMDAVRKTKTYKLGKAVLKPLNFLKK